MPLDAGNERHGGGDVATVNIRPGASILSVLKHLNYQPWFALAEFVDNSVQSYLKHRSVLSASAPDGQQLNVTIEVDGNEPTCIRIRDNAGGIAKQDFQRAFRAAAIPLDTSGLSEFGMGMKSAACWFAPAWQVRTQAIGDSIIRTIRFDVENIVRDDIEELVIEEEAGKLGDHFTEVTLDRPYHLPIGKTVAKIKVHLTDIYRCFTRDGTMSLKFGCENLVYAEPVPLVAPYYREENGEPRTWRKEIDFDFGKGLSARGFAALMGKGSFARSGFALFRRGRLIEGSGDDGYRPADIFGASSGSYRHLRLYGELHLEGFEVSHTKDGFRWDDNEEPFVKLLKDHLDSDELPLLRQADNFRAFAGRNDRARAAALALSRTADLLMEQLPKALSLVADAPPVETNAVPLPPKAMLASRELKFRFRDVEWTIRIQLADDPSITSWLDISNIPCGDDEQILEIRVAMAHPFMVAFAQTDPNEIEALIRVAAAVALGEVLAIRGGARQTGTIRWNMNKILRDALSRA